MTIIGRRLGFGHTFSMLLLLCAMLQMGARESFANPNMVANGDLEQPETKASVRMSGTENEAIFEFSGRQNFGRVIARGSSGGGKLAEGISVGYIQGGRIAGLMIDATKIKDVKGDYEIAVWFDLLGSIRPNRRYAYNILAYPASKGKVPDLEMIAPAFWADGEFLGAKVDLKFSDEIKTMEDLTHRGIVKTPDFSYTTGGQWLVLNLPKNFKKSVVFVRVSLRELDEALLRGEEPALPTPTRYITIDDVLEEQIKTAHRSTANAIRRGQNQQGYWLSSNPATSIRLTSIALDTLARQGEDLSSKKMRAGIKWLAEQETTETTAIARRLYFLANYGLPKYRKSVALDLNTLIDAQYEDGGWSTSAEPDAETKNRSLKTDNATTLVVVSALREAYYAGYKGELKTWRQAAGYFREAQSRDGGFRATLDKYGGLGEATTTLNTAAGMKGLLVTLDMAFAAGSPRCTQYMSNSRHLSGLRKGMEWLDKFYDEYYKKLPTLSVQHIPIYNAEAMQGFAELSGVTQLHGKDVFRTEAEAMMKTFDPGSGLFNGSFWLSAIALNFLDAGSAPIVFQRYIAGGEPEFAFSRDADHLARYLRSQRRSPLNWRAANIDDPIGELLDVPVFYVHVAGELGFEETHWERLREYCFGGGVVVFNIAEDQEAQRDVLRKGLATAFPEYKLNEIGKEDSILAIKHKLKSDDLHGMQTIGNGLKNFVFLTPRDWSCKLNTYAIKDDEVPFQFFDNLLHYTMDSDSPRSSFLTSTWEKGTSTAKSTKIAHMEVGADQPVFPDLTSTLSRSLESGYRMSVEEVPVDRPGKDVKLLWLSCGGPTQMTDKQLKTVSDHVKRGTFVFAEVLSGNVNWAESFRADLQKLDGDIRIRKLVANHPLVNGKLHETFGFDVRTVQMRRALRKEFKKLPRIDAYVIERNGEEIGVLSVHDVGSGLGYFLYPECRGIMPNSSRQFAANLVLYSMQRALEPSM
ncbi:MAG: DUF4159 domain-containing protein [Planctomycetes bacterium]|nr:DUF4159 domain-containing protein [Planctomycetota bacterium]